MLPDIRLDFITNIEKEYIDKMTFIRKEFMALDHKLRTYVELETINNDGAARCLSIARTHIETACQYAIKSLCIMGEIKE